MYVNASCQSFDKTEELPDCVDRIGEWLQMCRDGDGGIPVGKYARLGEDFG